MFQLLQLHHGAHTTELHGEARVCLARELRTVPALSFPSLPNGLEPDHSKDSVPMLQLCVLCLSTSLNNGRIPDSLSCLRYKNILHILAIAHSVIWITTYIWYLFVLM